MHTLQDQVKELTNILGDVIELLRDTTHGRDLKAESLEYRVGELIQAQNEIDETPVQETPVQETPVEETPVQEATKTINDVREATSAVIKADSNKKQAVRDLLNTFGAAKVTDLKEDQYADFITKVAEV